MRHKILFILAIILTVLFGFVTEDFIKSSIGKAMSARSTVTIKGAPLIEKPVEGGITPKANFIVSPSLVRAKLKQVESKQESLEIINVGDTILEITLELEEIEKFISISEKSFRLNQGKVKKIDLGIFVGEDEIPGVYIGRIVVKGDGITRIVKVVIEVKEIKPLLDITTEVVEKILRPMEDVRAHIRIVNLGDLRNINILYYYAIKSFEGSILTFKEENLEILEEIDIERSLQIPEGTVAGDYLFYSKVSYEDIEAASVDVFEVLEEMPAPPKKELINWIFLLVAIGLISVIFSMCIKEWYKESHGVYIPIKRR